MSTVGLRELRRYAADLVRRAEGGEEITITVSGRPRARLVSAGRRQWRSWAEVADLFRSAADLEWDEDRDRLDSDVRAPSTDR